MGCFQRSKSIYIDEEKLITPWRKVTGSKKKFTDHCAIRFEVDLHCNGEKYMKRTKVWNLKTLKVGINFVR